MSTVFDVVGRPIININGDWVKSSSFSSSSTVVLDPAAFLENWKKQIQGKHNIPAHQQRLTFACNHSPVSGVNLFSWNSTSEDQTAHVPVVGDFVTCLQSWQAILRSEKHNIARLLNPEVLTESDKLPSDLKSKAAEEFRNLGIPCSVYYLSFDKWILALHSQNCQETTQHCKELSSLRIQVDKDFQSKEFEVDLYGRPSKSCQPLHFSYSFNGRHLLAHISMLEQTALYRQGQKMRHSLGKASACIDKSADGSSAEPLLEADRTSTLVKEGSVQYYYIPGSKDQELIAVIKNGELRCIVLTVITLDGPLESLQTLMRPGNVFNERKTLAPDSLTGMQRKNRKEANRTQHECLLKPRTLNPLSRPKTIESAKEKGMLSAKLTKTRHGGILDSQASNSAQELSSSSFQTNNSSASSSVKQYTDSSKSNDLKRISKKKKRKKGKRNLKNSVSDSSAHPPEDMAQKSIHSSNVNEARVQGSGQISICESLQDAVLFDSSKEDYRNQHHVKSGKTKPFRTITEDANDLEVHSTSKGETTDTHCSCISDFSDQNSALLPRENSKSGIFKSVKHNYSRQDSSDDVSASAQNITSIDLIGGPIHQLLENGDKINNHLIESIGTLETTSIHASIASGNLVMHCNGLLCSNDGQAPLKQSREIKNPSVAYQSGSGSINSKGTVDITSDCKCGTLSEDKGVPYLDSVGNGTGSTSTNIDNTSGKTTFQCGGISSGDLHVGSGGRYTSEIEKAKDIMAVDNYERNKHSTQVGRNADIQGDSHNKKVRVAGGKKAARKTFGLGSSSSGSTNSSGIVNMQSWAGKENNHSIWQKIQKNTSDDHIHEPETSNHIQLPLSLASQTALLAANSAFAENNTSVPPSATCSHENSSCESKHREQGIRESMTYLEHSNYQGHIASYGVQSRFSVLEDSYRSQVRTDDISLQTKEKHTVGNSHKCATETGKVFQAIKAGHSHSHESIQSFQDRVLNESQQTDHPKSFLYDGSNLPYISHRKAKIPDTNQGDKCRSNSAPSTPYGHLELLHLSREDFSSPRSSSSIQGTLNQRLSLSSTSDSGDQQVLHTKNQGNEMPSTVNICEVKCLVDGNSFESRLQKAGKAENSEMRAFDENSIQQHCTSQYVSEQNISVEIKNEGMMRASTDGRNKEYDSSGEQNPQVSDCPSVTYMDTNNNIHKGSSENDKLHILDDDLESLLSTQETDMTNINLVIQTTADKNDRNNGVPCKCSSERVSEVPTPDVEFKKRAQVILNSISSSYQYQVASENVAHTIGSPLAEFEKVLYAVSPVIEHGKHSSNHGASNLVRRCEIADVPLKNIWNWFERSSNYGLEVKAEDFQRSERLGIEGNLYRAYFVPSLSGIQLFHFSNTYKSCCKGAKSSAWQEKNKEMGSAKDFHLPQYGNLHIDTLRALLPKPSATKETGAPLRSSSIDGSNFSSYDGNCSCSTWSEDLTYGNLEILFEYYESEQPQNRKPILEKIKELIKSGVANGSDVFGDPHILESVKLRDLHPASWFSIAWYPIYRIPEGPLRAAFLTYHSLGHFVRRNTSSNALDRDTIDCIVSPVVGLESYNAQAECWFIPKKQFQFSSEENMPFNVVMRERLRTLEETASLMARGCTKEGTILACSKQSDYEFFLRRRR